MVCDDTGSSLRHALEPVRDGDSAHASDSSRQVLLVAKNARAKLHWPVISPKQPNCEQWRQAHGRRSRFQTHHQLTPLETAIVRRPTGADVQVHS